MYYKECAVFVCFQVFMMGCAHQGASEKGASLQVENQLLKERVRRLEHRVQDLDAKIMFLAQNKNKNKVLKKNVPKKQAYRNSIDLDVVADDSRVEFESVHPNQQKVAFEALQQGGALGPQEIALEAVPIAPLTLKSSTKRVAHIPVAVSPKTSRSVMETQHGFAYMNKPSEQYDWARQQLLAHQCDRAIPAFQNLMERFPKNKLADNAMYWTAFCFAELGSVAEAQEIWRKLPLRFPRSPKRADAMFQRATLLEQEGKTVEASTIYMEIVKYYPKAEKHGAAGVALKRIQTSQE